MLPGTLYTADETRRLDAEAINRHGIPGAVLMERAGQATYRALRNRWPSARSLDVVCGPGNNGGDGFVIARLGANDGLDVAVHMVGDPQKLGDDARQMLDALRSVGIEPVRFYASRPLRG